jgi:hypothetical protein
MSHEEGSREIARQGSHQPGQWLDTSGGESDYDDIVTRHVDLSRGQKQQ